MKTKKYLYFATGGGADATSESVAVLADDICTVVPLSSGAALMYYRGTDDTINSIKFAFADTMATTGHGVKPLAKAIAEACNAGPHTDGMTDMVDLDNNIFYPGLSYITGLDIFLATQIDF